MNKVVLVTGASSGIGKKIAIFFAKSLGNFIQTYFTGYIGQNVVRIFLILLVIK